MREDRTLWCWGKDRTGVEQIELRGGALTLSANTGSYSSLCVVSQTGDLFCNDGKRLSTVGSMHGFAQVSVSNEHACALLGSGKISCWDMNAGFPTRAVSGDVLPGTESLSASQIASGDLHTCAIDTQKRLWCWDTPTLPAASDAGVQVADAGSDAGTDSGALLDAGPAPRPAVVPEQTDPLQSYMSVAVSRKEICAIRADGALVCWKDTYTTRFAPRIPDLTREAGRAFRAVALADDYGCAVALDGSLWCWGKGQEGQLGTGALQDSTLALRVGAKSDWRDVTVSVTHACALNQAQQIWCWGDNDAAALGTNTTHYVSTPFRLADTRKFVDVTLGSSGGCGVSDGHELWCWGPSGSHSVPLGTDIAPTRVGTASDWISVPVMNLSFSCGLRGQGAAWCWGDRLGDRLGSDNSGAFTEVPIAMHTGTLFSSLVSDATAEVLCGVQTSGKLACWGRNTAATFGQTTPESSATLVSVYPERSFRSVALTFNGTWGVSTAGELWEWRGGATMKLLGTGFGANFASWNSRAALHSDGQLLCWGANNSGQVGNGNTWPVETPTPVMTQERFASVHQTSDSVCALTREGQLYCWGKMLYIASGSGFDLTNTPRAVLPERRWKKVVQDNAYGACGIDLEGALYCWGDRSSRCLGPEQRYQASPLLVPLP